VVITYTCGIAHAGSQGSEIHELSRDPAQASREYTTGRGRAIQPRYSMDKNVRQHAGDNQQRDPNQDCIVMAHGRSSSGGPHLENLPCFFRLFLSFAVDFCGGSGPAGEISQHVLVR
jgi:hypothetical protein